MCLRVLSEEDYLRFALKLAWEETSKLLQADPTIHSP